MTNNDTLPLTDLLEQLRQIELNATADRLRAIVACADRYMPQATSDPGDEFLQHMMDIGSEALALLNSGKDLADAQEEIEALGAWLEMAFALKSQELAEALHSNLTEKRVDTQMPTSSLENTNQGTLAEQLAGVHPSDIRAGAIALAWYAHNSMPDPTFTPDRDGTLSKTERDAFDLVTATPPGSLTFPERLTEYRRLIAAVHSHCSQNLELDSCCQLERIDYALARYEPVSEFCSEPEDKPGWAGWTVALLTAGITCWSAGYSFGFAAAVTSGILLAAVIAIVFFGRRLKALAPSLVAVGCAAAIAILADGNTWRTVGVVLILTIFAGCCAEIGAWCARRHDAKGCPARVGAIAK